MAAYSLGGQLRARRPGGVLLAVVVACAPLATVLAEPVADLQPSTAEAGRHGGRLVVALGAEPKTFNPALTLDHPSRTVVRRLTADLIHIDRDTQGTVPALAKSWSVSQDGRSYTLDLRRGIRFSDGHPFDAGDVVFTIVTSSSNPERMGIATLIQQDLRQIGIDASVAGLEFRTLVDRVFNSFEYEACVLAFGGGDADPNSSLTLLSSDGNHHFWRLAADPSPWEAEIDRLMRRQLTEIDPAVRRDLYYRVQELVAENQPMIFLVSPNVLVGAARELGNFQPAILDHFTLWNVDELFWRSGGR